MKLKNKVVLVTGAGSGLGRSIALRFADEGADIVIATLTQSRGEETARLVRAKGVKALAITTDVSKSSAVAGLFEGIDHEGWKIDVLVNNAGSGGPLKPVQEIGDGEWDRHLAVHLSGAFFCTREAIKRMLPRKAGVILMMSSVAGMRGLRGSAAYTTAKGALIAFAKGVAQEVAPFGIRVNCMAPGLVDTSMVKHIPDEISAALIQMTPLKRLGRPEEIADLAVHLASDESRFIVGQTISPNGGLYT